MNSFCPHRALPLLIVLLPAAWPAACRADLRGDALRGAQRATAFLVDHVSTEGGYLWRYAADLSLREGEGVVDTQTAWVQPPGTPSVGLAFVHLYEATGDALFLEAARAAADALRRGQMRSGGWQAMIEFEPDRRRKWAYRVDPPRRKAKDQSSLDDDETQSALRMVMELDRALQFQDPTVHEMALYGLDGLLTKGQLPLGGFPQVWTGEEQAGADRPVTRASYPDDWPRSYPGHQEYWRRYTLNDDLAPTVLETLLLADVVYDDPRYLEAAEQLADFLLLAQMPAPQPAWAQQYSFDLQPIWARKFEPPAITGGESQGVVAALMAMYEKTGKRKYLEPIPAALDYLERSELADGRLARFYELQTNKPLYFTKDYALTYDGSDAPTHYSFRVPSRVDALRNAYNRLLEKPRGPAASVERRAPGDVRASDVRRVLDRLDDRGAWVTTRQTLRYQKHDGPVIDMRQTVGNLEVLARYLAGQSGAADVDSQ